MNEVEETDTGERLSDESSRSVFGARRRQLGVAVPELNGRVNADEDVGPGEVFCVPEEHPHA